MRPGPSRLTPFLVLAGGLALGGGLASALAPRPAAAEVIDLGSPDTTEVHFLLDPLTLVRIPPGAFGARPPGTYAWLTLDAPTCEGPNCIGGQGMLVLFDPGFSGELALPVTIQVRYDEEAVRRFGVEEEDLFFAWYNEGSRRWVPFSAWTIDTERNFVRASEDRDIRRFVAVFAFSPEPVAPATWGAVKGLFRDVEGG
jgi:hypothetical protein